MPLLNVKESFVIEKLTLQKELDNLFGYLEEAISTDNYVTTTFILGHIRAMLIVMDIEPINEPRYVSLTRLIKLKNEDLDFVPESKDQ